MTIELERLAYSSDGQDFQGILATPGTADTRPGVLVMPDAWGLTGFAESKARKIAELGYVALAGDLYGDGRVNESFEQCAERADALSGDPARMEFIVRAGLAALRSQPGVDSRRLAVIGFCLGGAVALNAARRGMDVRAVVSFHGLLKTVAPAQAGGVRASVLICTGVDDPLVPLEDVVATQHEMTAAGADCQLLMHTGVGHSFTRPDASQRPGFGYSADADARSFAAMAQLFSSVF
jgi:dienelactone hydrolase